MLPVSEIDERGLKGLLESFGSSCSLEDIASAYCKANRDLDLAAEILLASNNDGLKGSNEPTPPSEISEPSSEFPKSFQGKRNPGAGKSKFHSASFGTVSGIVGRDYIQNMTSTVPCKEANRKPLKLDAKELPESVIWGERHSVSTAAAKGAMRDDVVNFLFKMLGEGFELDKNKIHDVLGLCGYDVQKTMEKLLDISDPTMEKCDDVQRVAGKNSRDQHSEVSCASSEEVCNSTDSPNRDEDRVGLQREILGSIFTFAPRSEEAPIIRRPMRATPHGRTVVRPPKDTPTVQQSTVVESEIAKKEREDEENSYKALRMAVKQDWITMKEYYGAAVDAFAKGDYARADRLLQQGKFYNKKAREADEKSAQMVLKTNVTSDDEIPLDLREHEPKDAFRNLKIHLTSLSGISAIKYLRVIVGTGDEDMKGARKRLIIKQLDKYSIKWTEEDNGGTLRIQVDIIDPSSLSFAQKN